MVAVLEFDQCFAKVLKVFQKSSGGFVVEPRRHFVLLRHLSYQAKGDLGGVACRQPVGEVKTQIQFDRALCHRSCDQVTTESGFQLQRLRCYPVGEHVVYADIS